ncbi:hypothetical protein CgunFtcFv8_004680 [Champsocephalus gunnari]|uniref:P2X purinoceptor n=1 Tax=Champsocephalus gunnari TaxID=52237 RepID=A0AAN8HYZ9_CHAGU|nr:hypothetical protein CgunFtcFv8_004680 [Champsocephalus gunnari]
MSQNQVILQFRFATFGDSMLQKMNLLRHQRRFCDVTVRINQLEVPGHKVVFAAGSSFLRDQFILQQDSREVQISMIQEAEVGRQLLLSCYTGQLEFPELELVHYLTVASFLQMGHIVEQCTEALTMSGWPGCVQYLFYYETPKTLVIPNITAGCVFRLTQLLVVLYVLGYVCLVQKAYQETDSVVSTVTTKVKGFAFTNASSIKYWDVADYVIPPQGGNSFFVLTNMIATFRQTRARCPLLPDHSTVCVDDCDCIEGLNDPRGSGIQTGLCENFSTTVKTCEVISWCPLEIDSHLPDHALLDSAENFTVLIKNSVTYPKFNIHRRNIAPHINSSYLRSCEFNRSSDPDCPIFRLKNIVSEAGEDFQDMAVKGGILGIIIDWSCDLDWWAKKCSPKYSFRRLDSRIPNNDVAPGYNFRFAKYYMDQGGEEFRTLFKAYGIRFDVIVFGTAGKFGVVPTVVNLGAALSFLSLVPLVADWFLLTCLRKKDLYSRHKVSYLREDTDSEGETMHTIFGTK